MVGKEVALAIHNPCLTPANTVFNLKRGFCVNIGRGSDCELVVPNPYISRSHISISWVGDEIIVKDLESTNGTRVNGLRIASEKEISIGDKVSICDVTIKVCNADDSEIVSFESNDNNILNTTISEDKNIQATLLKQYIKGSPKRKKTQVITAEMLKNAGIDQSETVQFETPMIAKHNYKMTISFFILAIVLISWMLMV